VDIIKILLKVALNIINQTTICICMWILNLRWTTSQNNVQHENPGAMTKYVSNTCSDGNLITIVCILISLIAPLQLSSNVLWSLAVVSIVRIIILKVIFWTNKCIKAAEYTRRCIDWWIWRLTTIAMVLLVKSEYTLWCTTLCDKICQWLGPPVSFTDTTDRHDIIKILLKVALNIINQTSKQPYVFVSCIGEGNRRTKSLTNFIT
jgi:hypothetical protein